MTENVNRDAACTFPATPRETPALARDGAM